MECISFSGLRHMFFLYQDYPAQDHRTLPELVKKTVRGQLLSVLGPKETAPTQSRDSKGRSQPDIHCPPLHYTRPAPQRKGTGVNSEQVKARRETIHSTRMLTMSDKLGERTERGDKEILLSCTKKKHAISFVDVII